MPSPLSNLLTAWHRHTTSLAQTADASTGSGSMVGMTDVLAVAAGVVVIAVVLVLKKVGGQRQAVTVAAQRLAKGETDLNALRIEHNPEDPSVIGWNQLLHELKKHRDQQERQEAGHLNGAAADGTPEAAAAAGSLAAGIIVFDDAFTVRYANGAASRFLDGTEPKPNQDSVQRLLEPMGLAHVAQNSVTGSRAAVVEEHQQDPEDPRAGVVRVTCRRLAGAGNGAPQGYLLLLEDITQQRVAEAARHSFIAEATHELRMPLQNMRLYVEEVLELGEDDEDKAQRAEAMNIINSEVIRLGNMIEEVLSISAVESGSMSVQHDDVRLDELLKNLTEEYRSQAETKSIDLKLNLPSKLPTLQADRDKLSLALHNIVGNAVKYTPDNGRVSISVTTSASGLTIDIADTGYGIKPEEQERVFDRFFRANDQRVRQITGTGLGLAISREIIRLHHGEITLQSAPNEGSTFTIQLPPPAADSSANQAA